jgi:hypothetical protein
LLTGGSWFIFLFIKGESKTVIEFIQYQIRLFNTEDAGHGGPFYYHLIVLLIGCFPASVFAIVSVRKNKSDTVSQNNFKKWMMVLFCTVLILFSIVKTKIVHYSSLCWFPLTFLGAYSVYKIILKDMLWKKWMTVLTVVIASFIGAVLISPQFIDQYKTGIISSGIIKDSFAVENLNVDVYWSGYEFLSGLFFLTGTLFSVLVLRKRYLILATIILFLITLITVSISSIILIPKIEQYTQGAAIEFYTDKRKEYCKIETTGFKSYAHLFYAAQMPDTGNSIRSRSYYRVSKITSEEIIKSQCPDCTELYRKNGFIFWQKPVK